MQYRPKLVSQGRVQTPTVAKTGYRKYAPEKSRLFKLPIHKNCNWPMTSKLERAGISSKIKLDVQEVKK